ncbi:Hypothetical protein FKW44_005253 [Caligus rogercresseyi]|uniref:Uncharacterized protein n=1 Tax=Caligus rogercresseyi TaxID=217165 RepID=A0A7T8KBP8_CALRO|nr:Hypothetical protein FKW44_005253 [Caligus rogercresseyi]
MCPRNLWTGWQLTHTTSSPSPNTLARSSPSDPTALPTIFLGASMRAPTDWLTNRGAPDQLHK